MSWPEILAPTAVPPPVVPCGSASTLGLFVCLSDVAGDVCKKQTICFILSLSSLHTEESHNRLRGERGYCEAY